MKGARVRDLTALIGIAGIMVLSGTARTAVDRLQPTAMAATFTVTNTGDNGGSNPPVGAGTGTLRQAIVDANAAGGTNNIVFNIPGAGVQTINIFNSSQPLPTITSPVTIDGWSQGGAGYTGPPLIELKGPGGLFVVNGLRIAAGSSTVRGLVINRFNPCIRLDTNGGNVIAGNYVGTDPSGTMDLGSATEDGIIIVNIPNNTIGGTATSDRNIISGHNSSGIEIFGAPSTGNLVQGNYIGTDVTGTNDLGNGNGIFITFGASNNTIGGTAAGARNLISGNNTNGIEISSASSSGNQVQGNFIGTDSSGTADLGNGSVGVSITGPGNTVGGTAAGARNVISGNNTDGVVILGAQATGNQVQGNYIGTDASGAADLGNSSHGVRIENAGGIPPSNTIGGTVASARNVISGNNGSGVFISNSFISIVQGNYVGTDASGMLSIANSSGGVTLLNNASNNTIGGTSAGAGNLIAFNAARGVRVESGTGNSIRGNTIHSNAQLGIDLVAAGDLASGVTPNDNCDADSGSNNLQNFPLITSVTPSGANVMINGTLNSAASSSFNLDFYANFFCDQSGNGEGRTYIGSTAVNTDASCSASFSVTLPNPNAAVITATATNAGGNTSEFSPCADVPGVSFVVTNTADSGGGSLRQAILDANANPGLDTITFNIPGMGVKTIAPLSALPDLTRPVTIDGTTQPGYSGTPLIELDGTNAGGGFTDGLRIATTNTTIKGLAINRFTSSGIAIFTDENRIEGNYIGTDAGGTLDRGNAGGIFIGFGASNNTIGGIAPGTRNVISGNTFAGITLEGNGTAGNIVQGNYIGTSASGADDLGNSSVGVFIRSGASNNTIGGTTAAARNVISGNDFSGVTIESAGTTGNLVQGNYIGTDVGGALNLGNSARGVHIAGSASGNTIGGTSAGAGNLIAFNGGNGVRVESGNGNSIRGNTIHSNAQLGIDLVAAGDPASGVTPNDAGDADTGANSLQNFPVLMSAAINSMGTTIQGTLNSAANTTFTLEFFSNADCDPSGFGEGGAFIGSTTVMTDGGGNVSFTATFSAIASVGQLITATATDPANNTSEFSQCICGYLVAPTCAYFTSAGAEGSVNVTAQAGCAWTAVSNAAWMEITSAPNQNGTDTATFVVRDNNTGSARQGTLLIAGQIVTIYQDGGAAPGVCATTVSPAFFSFSASGGAGTINVTAGGQCAWQAVSNQSWTAITSCHAGSGNGTVTISVAANPGPGGRNSTIKIAGKQVHVKQKAP